MQNLKLEKAWEKGRQNAKMNEKLFIIECIRIDDEVEMTRGEMNEREILWREGRRGRRGVYCDEAQANYRYFNHQQSASDVIKSDCYITSAC